MRNSPSTTRQGTASSSFHRRRRAASTIIEQLEPRQLLSAVTTWSSRGPGGGGAFFSPSFSPFNSSELYTVSDMSGLYHSTNLGQSWTVADFRQIQGGIASQVQFTSDPNILYTLDYADTSDGSGSTAPTKSTDGGKTWTQVPGWNGADDQAFSLFADPQNTTNLLVTDYGTLYFSNNGGQSFNAVYTDPSSGQGCYVGGVFWDGSNIYVGTDSGLVTSTDGGAHFAQASVGGLPAGSSILSFAGAKQNGVTRLACVTADSGDVYNGLEMDSISQSSAAGVFTLTPGQSNWTAATSIPADDGPLIVSMALNDTSDIYVGGTDFNNGVPTIAKSTDGGHTFTDVLNLTNNGNVATGWQGAGGDRQWSFDQLTEGFQVSPANANDLAFTGYGYLHLSTDGGATWRQAYVNPADQNPAGSNTPKGTTYEGVGLEDTSTLYLSWADQQTILAGYTDINGVRSTDGGQSWSFPTGITLAGNTIYCITKQGSTLYAATSNTHDIYQSTHVTDASVDGGNGNILYSTDNGASWNVMHSFDHPVVWVATDPTNANRLYASVVSSTAGGIYVTNNLSAGTAATWTKVTNPPRTQGHAFNIDVLNDGTVVATFSGRRAGSFTDSSGVFVSTDNGQTWSDRTGAGMHWWTKDLTIDPTDPTQNTWYASVRFAYGTSGASGTGGLYRTTDRGQTWTQIFQSIGAESAAVSPTTGEMYVSTEENGLYYSANPHAATPVFTQTTYPFRQPERIFFNPYNANEIWVTSFGYGLVVGTTSSGPTTGSITGSIFNDVNGNGSPDNGEGALAGWTVKLNTGTSTTTNSAGQYTFSNLTPGAYQITETVMPGWHETTPTTSPIDLSVAAGSTTTAPLIGDQQLTGAITGTIFNDLNGNGKQDSGEGALSGWTVKLNTGASTMTNSAGQYTFSNLPVGSYQLTETIMSGWKRTTPTTSPTSISVTAGNTTTAPLFGDQQLPGAITGSIFNDLNANAKKDASEGALSGWVVTLTTGVTATTDAAGHYTFRNLRPGSYTVAEVVKSGWRRTTPTTSFTSVTVAAGATAAGPTFGDTQRAMITGNIFNDVNGDGVKAASGEGALGGWVVTLNTGVTATTDATGKYVFNNLAPGTYKLTETVKAGWRRTTPTTSPVSLTLGSGQAATGPAFGDTQRALITGIVFNDANGNKKQDSAEKGLAGWHVTVQIGSNPVLQNIVTNSAGGFSFDIAAGTYLVKIVAQAKYTLTTSASLTVTVGSGGVSATQHFGEKKTA